MAYMAYMAYLHAWHQSPARSVIRVRCSFDVQHRDQYGTILYYTQHLVITTYLPVLGCEQRRKSTIVLGGGHVRLYLRHSRGGIRGVAGG